MLLVWIVATAGYVRAGWSFQDAIYMVTLTVFTVCLLYTSRVRLPCSACSGRRRAKTCNGRDVLGTRAQGTLLPAAFDQRLANVNVAAAHERARALRSAKLVRRDAQEIGAKLRDRTINSPGRLHRIDMQHAIGRMHDRRDLGYRLNDASFVIGLHDRHQRALGPQQASFKLDKIHNAVAIDRQYFDRIGRKAAAAKHRGMLYRRYEQPVTRLLAATKFQSRRQCQHVGFGGAGRKSDVLGLGPDQGLSLIHI